MDLPFVFWAFVIRNKIEGVSDMTALFSGHIAGMLGK
jgi:hypothetical protein